MKFNSQICSTKEQSERLLALGLKKETADMYYSHDKGESIYAIRACWEDFWGSTKLIDGYIRRRSIPAWSLHRLLCLLPSHIGDFELYFDYPCEVGYNCLIFFNKGCLYDNIIDCIEWLIKEGYFKKEYLE